MREFPIDFTGPEVRATLNNLKSQKRLVLKPQPIKIGDLIWVRETWLNDGTSEFPVIHYRADDTVVTRSWNDTGNWRSSRSMPKAFSRLRLQVTEHRIERLQDISEIDALFEGIEIVGFTKLMPGPLYACKEGADPTKHYTRESETADTARVAFWHIWDSLYGKKNPWKSNPFVDVIDFEVVK